METFCVLPLKFYVLNLVSLFPKYTLSTLGCSFLSICIFLFAPWIYLVKQNPNLEIWLAKEPLYIKVDVIYYGPCI